MAKEPKKTAEKPKCAKKASAWKPIVNKAFTEKDFRPYVQSVVLPNVAKHGWRPRGIILHHTGSPTLAQWPGTAAGKPITAEQRLRNLEHYYRDDNGWSAGPHFFVSPTNIHAFTPAW